MYLSRMYINPRRRAARGLLASPQAMHAALLAAFPPGVETSRRDEGRLLWRTDQLDHAVALYVVSLHEPDLSHLIEQAGWVTQPWKTRRYDSFLASLSDGDRWAFRLTANPVRSGLKSYDSSRTQRFGHVTPDQQVSWLLDRTESAGFRVSKGVENQPLVRIVEQRTLRFKRGGDRVTLRTATFDGILEVASAESLRRVLRNGLGHAKAYGCGLLTLAAAE